MSNDGFFGFGAQATGAPATTEPVAFPTQPPADPLANFNTLVAALTELKNPSASPTLLSIPEGDYEFKDQKLDFVIKAKQVTIQAQAGANVVLRNITIRVDLASIDRILIQDLVFRSDGEGATGDGIRLTPAEDATTTTLGQNFPASVRITHCSFNGYDDIAIDSRSSVFFPFLAATIDHCLFFDSRPGMPDHLEQGESKLPFVDRGAINIGSTESPGGGPQLPSHSVVTVAYNAFIDVWRRCPRIADGNFGHIFNNILYRWGTGHYDDANGGNTWRGIEIGGGDGITDVNRNDTTNGTALIEANRFIPDPRKADLNDAINIRPNTIVDVGVSLLPNQPSPNQPNRFDDDEGRAKEVTFLTTPAVGGDPKTDFTVPSQGFTIIGQVWPGQVSIPRPAATPVNNVDWKDLVRQAGPRRTTAATSPENVARQKLLDVKNL